MSTRALVALAGLVALAACSKTKRTVVVGPDSEVRGPSTAVTIGVPPGHLPDIGECRIWIPGTPPGRQPKPKSRPCAGISAFAPAGSWILYRPGENRKLLYRREVDSRQSGLIIRTRIFDIETTRLVREETP